MASTKAVVGTFLALVVSAPAAARSEPAGPRAAEVAEIVANIERMHPHGRYIAAAPAFVETAADLEASADRLDLADYIMRLHRLFARVADGHTAVLSLQMQAEPFRLRLPISVQPFADGLYVIEAKDEAEPLLGGRVVEVNGTRIERVLDSYVNGAPGDNPAFAMRWAPFLFAFPGWLHGLGFADGEYGGPIELAVLGPGGSLVRARLRPREGANLNREPLQRKRSAVEQMAAEERGPNFARVLPDKKAVYISLDAMTDTEAKSFEAFTREVGSALTDDRVERVVLDLRRNGGGNNLLAEPLRRTLVTSRFNTPGALFVLIGPRTFSAAMNMATRLERETDALFVGEPTGGRPNHYGDARLLTGSATGVQYLVSTMRWQDSTPFDERIWILPDLPAPALFGDYLAGRDRALEAALSTRAADFIADDARIAEPWTRRSQQAGWRFFFEPGSDGVSGPRTANRTER